MNSRGLLNHSLDTANQIWLGSSDGPRIWSIETNRTWIYRHALVRATRSLIEFRGCIYSEASGCNINYLNFLTRPYLVGDLLYCIKLFCQILNGSYTTNTHKLCSNDRFVIWLAQAPWRHRKLKPTSCWVFQSLMNLLIPSRKKGPPPPPPTNPIVNFALKSIVLVLEFTKLPSG